MTSPNYIGNGIYIGISTDTKPTTAPTGAIMIETDTRTTYVYDGANWETERTLTDPRIKRTGYYMGAGNPGLSSGGLSGLLNGRGTTIAVGTGVFSQSIGSSGGFGLRGIWSTGTTINSLGGTMFVSSDNYLQRIIRPKIECRLATRTATTTVRVFFGFTSKTSAPTSLASPLDSLSGIAFFYDSAVDGNWHIHQNDGSVTADITTIANVAAANTNPHVFGLRAVTDTKFQYQYDGGAWTDITTKIPASTTNLGFQWYIECLANSAARSLDVYWAAVECAAGP